MSERGPLPDTVPIPSAHKLPHAIGTRGAIDFSETASTGRRSSPCIASTEAGADVWDFSDVGSDGADKSDDKLEKGLEETETGTKDATNRSPNRQSSGSPGRSEDIKGRTMQTRSMAHAQEKLPTCMPQEEHPELRCPRGEVHEPGNPIVNPSKTNKPKQASKAPLQFDEKTRVIESPRVVGPGLHASPTATNEKESRSTSDAKSNGALQTGSARKPGNQSLYTYGKQRVQNVSSTVPRKPPVANKAFAMAKIQTTVRPSPLKPAVGVDMDETPQLDETTISPAMATSDKESIDDVSSPITIPDLQTMPKTVEIRTESHYATRLRQLPKDSPSGSGLSMRKQTSLQVSPGSESPRSHISCSTFPSQCDGFSQELSAFSFGEDKDVQVSMDWPSSKLVPMESIMAVPSVQAQPGLNQPGAESVILGESRPNGRRPRRMSVSETGSPMSRHLDAPAHQRFSQHFEVNDGVGEKTCKILKTRSIYGPDPFRPKESGKVLRKPSNLEYTSAPVNKLRTQAQKQPKRITSLLSESFPTETYRNLRSRMNGAAAGVSELPKKPVATPSRLETELGQFTHVSRTASIG